MYIPKHFREDDMEAMHTFMDAYSFAILVAQQHDGTPFASHLPFMIDTTRGTYGTLAAHMARANSQWQDFSEECEVLVIFRGPHAYVSPSWYDAALSVPTWNYAAVHAYGKPHIIEDKTAWYHLLKRLIEKHEAQFERPWPFQLPDEYLQNMMRGTVAFEIEITKLEGKFKLSQNRPMSDRIRVAEILEKQGDELSVGIADLMKARQM